MTSRPPKLLWKIWLSTSVALTALFGVTGVILQRQTLETAGRGLQEEVEASFLAYESLWRSRSETLAAIAFVLSNMAEVRAAFGTGHRATIRDTAGEIWLKISDQLRETAFLAVSDPAGTTVASLDTASPGPIPAQWPAVREARNQFPKQVSGFAVIESDLYQLVLSPVYVDSVRGPVLINVLITGFKVNHLVAQRLKESTAGSEFLFLSGSRVFASTLNDRATKALARASEAAANRISDGVREHVPLRSELVGLDGKQVGHLVILRSLDDARDRIRGLQRNLLLLWLIAIAAGLCLTYALARRIVKPIETFDRAATEVARQNYDFRLPVAGQDELGRLAATFNSMCASLQSARQELIRQERISTIGRMATSIVHDLRNPLAAIYGGAEMMVDTDLTTPQMKRVAANIYQASRRIQEMLQDLLQIHRGKPGEIEMCRLAEVVEAATDALRSAAESQKVELAIRIPDDIELPLDRSRIERVFFNLFGNALEMLPDGGGIMATARLAADDVLIEVSDSGPGISPQIRDRLFQPFVSHGKRTGLGLGLALARQTVLDHGGDMWIDSAPGGARFHIRLPKAREESGTSFSLSSSRTE